MTEKNRKLALHKSSQEDGIRVHMPASGGDGDQDRDIQSLGILGVGAKRRGYCLEELRSHKCFWVEELLVWGDGQGLQGDECLLLKLRDLTDRWGYLHC